MKRTLGIVREGYSKWERRSPLTPSQIEFALTNHVLDCVLIQSSARRVFTDEEYRRAGAKITEDLSPSDCIIGVKQIPPGDLIEDKTYVFFSHTIKAQESNMSLLDSVLEKRVRLVDHECIRDVTTGQRLVAFGDFAGRAGMLESIRGLGLRLLGLGISSPFLNIGPAYTYKTLEEAEKAAAGCVEEYHAYGGAEAFLPKGFGPLCFVLTGAGKVSTGAQKVFRALGKHAIMLDSISELKTKMDNPDKVYAIVVRDADIIRRPDSPLRFNRDDYLKHPEMYSADNFATEVLPFANVVLTGAYWDARYPRWMPDSRLVKENSKQLLMVSDVACDIKGTFGGLHRSTTIEDPFYYVDFSKPGMPEVANSTKNEMDLNQKLVLGVDILPSELPRDASQHFGDCLFPFLRDLCSPEFPPVLQRATIAQNGKLTPPYVYIDLMRKERDRSGRQQSIIGALPNLVVQLQGHLFDTRLINRVLDLVEFRGGKFKIAQALLAQPRGGPGRETRAHTTVLMQLEPAPNSDNVDDLYSAIERLIREGPSEAEASIFRVDKERAAAVNLDLDRLAKSKKDTASWTTSRAAHGLKDTIAIFGAGMVSHPAIEYMLKHRPESSIRIITGDEKETHSIKQRFLEDSDRFEFVLRKLDANKAAFEDVSDLLKSCKCVLSLLPATMHSVVARACLKTKIPMVTASYVGALKEFESQAVAMGIPILCEMGLDPGMDHMSVARAVQDAKSRNGALVESFESYCGGLVSPECADNALGYKFSWSPRGVLTALKNPARFIRDGQVVDITGGSGVELLQSAKRFELQTYKYPSFNLEAIPNRDSTAYMEYYNIPQTVQNVFRGTLRFHGFCDVMSDFARLGWLDDANGSLDEFRGRTWGQVISSSSVSPRTEAFVATFTDRKIKDSPSRLDALCEVFKDVLKMESNDRDLVMMEHRFKFTDGSSATSTLIEFGNDRDTAMSRTVGITAAIGVCLLLEGKHPGPGIHLPTARWVFDEALDRLKHEGIQFAEKVESDGGGSSI